MKVFVASSRRFYEQVKVLKERLDAVGVVGFYPYFDLGDIEGDETKKRAATLEHFPEIDEVDVVYLFAPGGYIGYSVAIEAAYAFAKGKEILSSEPISEFAVKAMVSRVVAPEEFVKRIHVS